MFNDGRFMTQETSGSLYLRQRTARINRSMRGRASSPASCGGISTLKCDLAGLSEILRVASTVCVPSKESHQESKSKKMLVDRASISLPLLPQMVVLSASINSIWLPYGQLSTLCFRYLNYYGQDLGFSLSGCISNRISVDAPFDPPFGVEFGFDIDSICSRSPTRIKEEGSRAGLS